MGYELVGQGSIPSRGKRFFSSVQTNAGAHISSYMIGTGGSFPRGKAGGAWSWPDHSPPRAEVAKVKNGGAIPSLPIHLQAVMLN
jgi:hypothetical protein